MATRPRRRFPLLALLAVVVAAGVLLYSALALGQQLTADEVRIERYSGTVEFRRYVCGALCSSRRPASYNELASRYAKLGRTMRGREQWQRTYMQWYWHGQRIGNCRHEDIGTAVYTTSLLLGGGKGLPNTDVKWTDAAADKLTLDFMGLLRPKKNAATENHTPHDELVDNYSYATWKRLADIDGDITPEDLIPLDTWLADPVPEHYFGPDRIH